MRPFPLLLLAAASALAQSVIDYSKIPGCARQCTVLDQAEKGCVPPAAPVSDQGIYQSCFCLSALLTPLHSNGDICKPACGDDDAGKITQYYNSLCNGPVVQPAPTTTTSTSTTPPTGTATAPPASSFKSGEEKEDWFKTHWKWVVMVIVIAIAIVVFWVGGIYLRRHYERKADAKRANLAATDAPYNPRNQNSSNTSNAVAKAEMPPDMAMTALPPVAESTRQKLRSRSSTLTSGIGMSKPNTPQPVVWGPHQHLAHSRSQSRNASPLPSVPPSPTHAITPPGMPFRNRNGSRSDPRFVHYRATPTSITVEETNYGPGGSARGRPRFANEGPSTSAETIERAHSVLGEPIRDVKRRTLTAVKSDPGLAPLEPQAAQICEASPQKLQKVQKH